MKREYVFVTTKLWSGRGYSDTLKSIDASLKELDLGYIELSYLLSIKLKRFLLEQGIPVIPKSTHRERMEEMKKNLGLENKIALVTGGSGIGRAIAQQLVKEGAKVIVTGAT